MSYLKGVKDSLKYIDELLELGEDKLIEAARIIEKYLHGKD